MNHNSNNFRRYKTHIIRTAIVFLNTSNRYQNFGFWLVHLRAPPDFALRRRITTRTILCTIPRIVERTDSCSLRRAQPPIIRRWQRLRGHPTPFSPGVGVPPFPTVVWDNRYSQTQHWDASRTRTEFIRMAERGRMRGTPLRGARSPLLSNPVMLEVVGGGGDVFMGFMVFRFVCVVSMMFGFGR